MTARALGALRDLASRYAPATAAGERPQRSEAPPIVLVGASDEQQPTGSTPAPALNVYVSPVFRLSVEYARTLVGDERIRIVSPKWGAIELDDHVTSHDFPLRVLSAAHRRAWGARVVADLLRAFGTGPLRVVVLANERFLDALRAGAQAHAAAWTFEAPLAFEPPVASQRQGVAGRARWLRMAIERAGSPARLAEAVPPAPGSADEDLAAMVTFIRERADTEAARFGTHHRPAWHSERIGNVLRKAAATIQRRRLARPAAVEHLRELASAEDAPELYLARPALFTVAKGIERGKHLGAHAARRPEAGP
jgi:hypothetical protein